MSFAEAFAAVIGVEGGLSLDATDSGNWTGGQVGKGALRGTKYGISAAAFPTLNIAALTLDQAQALYRAHYWQAIGADALPPAVAVLAFDCAVNQGPAEAVKLLQLAVAVPDDGDAGPQTQAALKAAVPATLFRELWARRALQYAGDAGLKDDGLGWFRRLATIGCAALAAT